MLGSGIWRPSRACKSPSCPSTCGPCRVRPTSARTHRFRLRCRSSRCRGTPSGALGSSQGTSNEGWLHSAAMIRRPRSRHSVPNHVSRRRRRVLYLAVIGGLAGSAGRPATAQDLPVSDPLVQYLRVLQVAGAATPIPLSIRPFGFERSATRSAGGVTRGRSVSQEARPRSSTS